MSDFDETVAELHVVMKAKHDNKAPRGITHDAASEVSAISLVGQAPGSHARPL